MEAVAKILDLVVGNAERGSWDDIFRNVIENRNVIELGALDGPPAQPARSLDELFFRKEGIPVRSPLLTRTKGMPTISPKVLRKELAELTLRSGRLKDILDDTQAEWRMVRKQTADGEEVLRPEALAERSLQAGLQTCGRPG